MTKVKKFFSLLRRDSDLLKSANYIVTSDYNTDYINPKKIKKLDLLKWIYLVFILFAISISFIPLFGGEVVTGNNAVLLPLQSLAFSILFIDYLLRWSTYSFRANEKSRFPLLIFPFTGISLIMALGFLPTLALLISPLIDSDSIDSFLSIVSSLVIFQVGRLILLLNVVPPFRMFTNIFKKQRKILTYVFLFLILITILFAVIIYRAEFNHNPKILNYWDAFYFTVISICTIGYGDITPQTDLGQAMIVILAFVGVAIFTIPSAVIAGGFLNEMQERREEMKNPQAAKNKSQKKELSIIEKTILKSYNRNRAKKSKLASEKDKVSNEKDKASNEKDK